MEIDGQSGWIDIKGKAKEMQVGRKEIGGQLISQLQIDISIVYIRVAAQSSAQWKWLFPFPGLISISPHFNQDDLTDCK